MAHSQSDSLVRAQTLKPCELCEQDITIDWKCLDCRKYMCKKCKNIHSKFPSFLQHTIIDCKAFGDVQEEFFVADQIPCQVHKKKMHVMYCRSCNVLVCSQCIASFHKQHNLDSIEIICDEKLERIKTLGDQISEHLTVLKTEKNRTKSDEAEMDSKFDDTIKIIEKKEKEVTEVVSQYAQELKDESERKRKQMKKSISDRQNKIEEAICILEKRCESLQQASKSAQVGEILNAAEESIAINIQYPVELNILPEASNFIQGEITPSNIMNLFGSLEQTETQKQTYIDLIVTQSYTTDIQYVHRIVFHGDYKVWISHANDKIFRQISLNDKMKITKDISAQVYDMVLNPSGDVILSLVNSSEVQILTKTGELKPFISVSPLLTRGIHVTKDNEIMLGVKENGSSFPLTDASCRQVLVFNTEGKQTQCFEYNRYNQRLFTMPCRIKSNSNDIVVVDATSFNTGKVIGLGRKDHRCIKWIYVGHPIINPPKTPFNPKDIAKSKDHIVAADHNANAIHIISAIGELLTCKVMVDHGIIRPYSLDIDPTGMLWVGCDTHTGKKDAKIHVIKFK